MESASLTVSLAMMAGVLAQGIAVHLRLPGIVVLLGVGVLLGPDVANLVRPQILGGSLQAFVGFAVAIILFEGGLSMNLKRLRKQAKAIRRLVTIGALITAAGGAIAAKIFMPGWDWRLSILFGTLVIVTGPTVITPLLRRLRVRESVATVLEAEGIFIDAVGATIAVVALEVALIGTVSSAAVGVLDVVKRIGIGALVGGSGGALLAILVRWRRVVPEGLENILALSFAVAVFQISDSIVHESGITAAIVAGMILSNTQSHAFEEIVEFKEQLTAFFIATLFVLLAADVRVANVVALGWPGLLTVVALMFVVRPITVTASTWGTPLNLREKVFLSWLAPRGIVAAAVASLFAIELGKKGVDGGVEMRALVFLVIATTVTVQGLTGGALAAMLKLRRAAEDGFVILGANRLARRLAKALVQFGHKVVVIDSNMDHCRDAEEEGLMVVYGNGLEEVALARARASTRSVAIGLTPNESINFLFARRALQLQGPKVFVGLVSEDVGVTGDMVEKEDCHILFGGERSLGMWISMLGSSGQVREETWELRFPPEEGVDFGAAPASAILPLLAHRGGKGFLVNRRERMKKGDFLLVILRKDQRSVAHDWLRDSGFVPAGAERADTDEG